MAFSESHLHGQHAAQHAMTFNTVQVPGAEGCLHKHAPIALHGCFITTACPGQAMYVSQASLRDALHVKPYTPDPMG